jgi:biotin carboxyl carrier protein
VADPTVTALGKGVYRIQDRARSRLAYAVANGDARWVFLDGRVYLVDAEDLGSEGLLGEPKSTAVREPKSTVVGADLQVGPGESRASANRNAASQSSRAASRRRRSDDHGALAAPMPATVLRIVVEPGQRVSKGEVLVVLEAMKMELAIKAPRDASVKAIACAPGELVQPGVPLLEREEEDTRV